MMLAGPRPGGIEVVVAGSTDVVLGVVLGAVVGLVLGVALDAVVGVVLGVVLGWRVKEVLETGADICKSKLKYIN